MHREIRQGEGCLEAESPRSLYFLTILVFALIVLDLAKFLPPSWLASIGASPTWFPGEIWGMRFALLAAVIGGGRALYSALDSLTQGRPGADLAIAIAALSAILLREHLVAAEVVLVGLLGECLEWWTFERTKRELRGLFELSPDRCWRVLPDGTSEKVQTTQVRVGDKIGVKPGARVPVDGVILEGTGFFDTSALTGESQPKEKGPGDEVLAGFVNLQARVVVEARRVAEHTVAGRIAEWTATALKNKASLETQADRYARWFLPVVLALAALTLVFGLAYHWSFTRDAAGIRPPVGELLRRAAYPALGVLVVTCPCALLLATPAAVIAAMGRLAGTGILIKGGAALERLASIETLAFDKTGTLTQGSLAFKEAIPWDKETSSSQLLEIAARVESASDHPVARCVIAEAQRLGLPTIPLDGVKEVPGRGVVALEGENEVRVGNLRFLSEAGQLDAEQEAWATQLLESQACSGVAVSRGGRFLGILLASDEIRPSASVMIRDLKGLGIGPLTLLTGDNEKSAALVSCALELNDFRAGLLPRDKATWVEECQKTGRKIGFVGDGVNDAVALAQADASIAVGRGGADIAAQVSDMVILGEPLEPLPFLVRLSRQTVAIIQQNIVYFAFGLNLLGILITSWLWPWFVPAQWESQSPLAAVLYHQVASVAVLLNSMRLLWFEKTGTLEKAFPGWNQTVKGWDRFFDLDEWLHEIEHHAGRILVGLGLVLGLVWATSNLKTIATGEVGMVRRFGRLLEPSLEPGLHWRLPYPLETITVAQPEMSRTVELGFRTRSSGNAARSGSPGPGEGPKTGEWTSSHIQEGILRYPEESLVVTGDGNLVEVFLTVRFRKEDPVAADLLGGAMEPWVRSQAESILRELVASRTSDQLLGQDRGELAVALLERLKKGRNSGAQPVSGLLIEDVTVHDLHPPREVVAAYHAVAKAMENGQKRVRDAETLVLRRLSEENSRADRLTKISEAERDSRIKVALARSQAFLTRLGSRKGFEELVDFRLFWDAVGTALATREKILVDLAREPVRTVLWFVPPEVPRPPAVSPSGSSGAGSPARNEP